MKHETKATSYLLSDNITSNKKLYRILILGDGSVGKTELLKTLLKQEINHIYNFFYVDTYVDKFIGNSIYNKTKFNNISFTDIHLVYLCFDINRDFLDQLGYWIKHITELKKKVKFIVIGCKSDLRNKYSINTSQARDYAIYNGAINYLECSCLTNNNIHTLIDITKEISISNSKCMVL
jgi:GTPase SAR1 family protein